MYAAHQSGDAGWVPEGRLGGEDACTPGPPLGTSHRIVRRASSLQTVAPQWKPGDTVPLGPSRALRVVGTRVTDVDETPVLIVEDDAA
jgi:hypothetical protein